MHSIAVIVKYIRFLRKQVTGGCNGLAEGCGYALAGMAPPEQSVRRPTESSPRRFGAALTRMSGRGAGRARRQPPQRDRSGCIQTMRSLFCVPGARLRRVRGTPLTPITLAGRITPCARPSMRRCGRALPVSVWPIRGRQLNSHIGESISVSGKHATTGSVPRAEARGLRRGGRERRNRYRGCGGKYSKTMWTARVGRRPFFGTGRGRIPPRTS